MSFNTNRQELQVTHNRFTITTVALAAAVLFGCGAESASEPTPDPEPETPEEAPEAEEGPEPEEDEVPDEVEETSEPTITDDHVATVEGFAADESAVQEAAVTVDGDTVSIALVVNPDTPEEEAQRLLENAARLLASQVAVDTEGLAGPKVDSLGELWDHYSLLVAAGPEPASLIAQGAKAPGSPRISW
jgi:hypothetical protein